MLTIKTRTHFLVRAGSSRRPKIFYISSSTTTSTLTTSTVCYKTTTTAATACTRRRRSVAREARVATWDSGHIRPSAAVTRYGGNVVFTVSLSQCDNLQ